MVAPSNHTGKGSFIIVVIAAAHTGNAKNNINIGR